MSHNNPSILSRHAPGPLFWRCRRAIKVVLIPGDSFSTPAGGRLLLSSFPVALLRGQFTLSQLTPKQSSSVPQPGAVALAVPAHFLTFLFPEGAGPSCGARLPRFARRPRRRRSPLEESGRHPPLSTRGRDRDILAEIIFCENTAYRPIAYDFEELTSAPCVSF
jgi:hypothetical protein